MIALSILISRGGIGCIFGVPKIMNLLCVCVFKVSWLALNHSATVLSSFSGVKQDCIICVERNARVHDFYLAGRGYGE